LANFAKVKIFHPPISNAPWPDDRPRVSIGRLEITRTTTVEKIGDPVMMHDPTRRTDGIEPSDDPILAVRRGVYEISVANRTGGWKGRQAALDRGDCPFGGGASGRRDDRNKGKS
jgi:catalase